MRSSWWTQRWPRACGALLLLCLLAGCRTELFGKLDEAEANAVLDVLYAEGIEAVKLPGDSGAWRIEVDQSQHQRALHVARRQGLPQQRFATMGEVFRKEGLVSSPQEERMRHLYAVSQELAQTLSLIDGVVAARVHPVMPVHDPLSDKARLASAAVFIKHRADADVQQLAPAIRTMVTRSIEGLSAEQVSLTFFATRSPLPPQPSAPPAPAGSAVVTALAATLALVTALALVVAARRWRRREAAAARMPPARGIHGA